MKSTLRQMLVEFGSRSIYVRLTIYAIVIIAVSTALRVVFVTTVLDRDAKKTAAESQLAAASYIARDIDGALRLRFDLLRLLVSEAPRGSRAEVKRWLDGNPSSRVLFSAGLDLYEAADAAGQEWYAKAIESSQPVIARLYADGLDHRGFLMMAAAIRDGAGKPIAVITGTTALLEDNFLRPVYEQKYGEQGSVLVIDPVDNILITSSLGPKLLAPAAPPGVNPLHDQGRAGFRGVGETVNADGQTVLSAMVSIPSSGWFVVVQQPTEQAYLPVLRLKKNFIFIGALNILVAGGIIYFCVSFLLTPLADAARRLHAMARSDEPVDFLPLHRNDEIGLIVTGFNSLLAKLRKKEALVSHLAHHDALTGLPNLQLFRDRLTQGLLYAQRHDSGLTLLYLDLDGFKPVNDCHGHAAGDFVLQEVARRVSGQLRKSDTVARIGGDEFAVILTDSGDSAGLVADKCRDAICRPMEFEGQEISVGVSIGMAYFPIDGTSQEELLKKADADMYRAKRGAHKERGEACK